MIEAGTGSLLERVRASLDPLQAAWEDGAVARAHAAVLLLLDPSDAGVPLLFIRRSELVRSHRGQIAFPGGGADRNDLHPAATALREAAEEVGVLPASVEVLGQLRPVFTATSNRWLVPVVAVLREPVSPVSDRYEVGEWFWLRLGDLLVAPQTVRHLGGPAGDHPVRFYTVGERVIWGASAAVLHDLLERLGRED